MQTKNMVANWYCLIFGEELGPMSWDDLVAMAAHGTLGKHEQVKQGTDSAWLAAESVPGLFPSNSATLVTESSNDLDFDISAPAPPASDADTDFEVTPPAKPTAAPESAPADTDFELSAPAPASSASAQASSAAETDFDISVQQPTPVDKVASSAETDFDLAAPRTTNADDDADFDIAPAPASHTRVAPPAEADDDFDLAPSIKPAAAEEQSEETDFDAGPPPPARTTIAPAESNEEQPEGGAAAPPIAKKDAAAPSQPAQSSLEIGKRPPEVAHTKKPKEKASGLSAPTKRALTLLLGAVGGLASACLVYLGIVALLATRRPNYDEILTGYDQLFQQAQAAKDDLVLGNPQATMEFLTALKTLRGRLRDTQPDSADAQLAEAGTLLAQLYATAGASPESETGQERKAAETAYLAKISAVRTKLGE